MQKDVTPAQVALGWLLGQKPWIAPIPGTTKLQRLKENIGAVTLNLSHEDIQQIEDAASQITIQGARYPLDLQNRVGK